MANTSEDRIWIDGCFDFMHHGHAGAMLQARQLGNFLVVGVHSDEEIERHKGPVVMHLDERMVAVEACKWCSQAVPNAPYITDPSWMDKYGCRYVVHGDDITTDENGNDTYQEVKDLGRFKVVKRTPDISTTDIIGRMLDCGSTTHHLPSIKETLANGQAGSTKPFLLVRGALRSPFPSFGGVLSESNITRYTSYATGEDGKLPKCLVYAWVPQQQENDGSLVSIVSAPWDSQEGIKAIYVDGSFDLFFAGHIEFLRLVCEKAKTECPDFKLVVGIHDDPTVNAQKGQNFPLMNLYERTLCVLQCRYVDAVILGAPFSPSVQYLAKLGPQFKISSVYHGPSSSTTSKEDPYKQVKEAGLYKEIQNHKYKDMSVDTIFERVKNARSRYEERQRNKGWKSEHESRLKGQQDNNPQK